MSSKHGTIQGYPKLWWADLPSWVSDWSRDMLAKPFHQSFNAGGGLSRALILENLEGRLLRLESLLFCTVESVTRWPKHETQSSDVDANALLELLGLT